MKRFLIAGSLAALLVLGSSVVDVCFVWKRSVWGDGAPWESKETFGLRYGIVGRYSEDAYSTTTTGLKVDLHEPAFHEPLVVAGFMDFGVVGVAAWAVVALLLAAYLYFGIVCRKRGSPHRSLRAPPRRRFGARIPTATLDAESGTGSVRRNPPPTISK